MQMVDSEISNILKDVGSLSKDLSDAEKKHIEYTHALKQMTNLSAASTKNTKHIKYVSSQLMKDIKRLLARKDLSEEELGNLKKAEKDIIGFRDKCSDMQCDLPAEDNGYIFFWFNL